MHYEFLVNWVFLGTAKVNGVESVCQHGVDSFSIRFSKIAIVLFYPVSEVHLGREHVMYVPSCNNENAEVAHCDSINQPT